MPGVETHARARSVTYKGTGSEMPEALDVRDRRRGRGLRTPRRARPGLRRRAGRSRSRPAGGRRAAGRPIAQLKAEIKQLRIELEGNPLADPDDAATTTTRAGADAHQLPPGRRGLPGLDAPRDVPGRRCRSSAACRWWAMQTLVALGVFAGTISQPAPRAPCAAGTFCGPSDSVWSACRLCGADPPPRWTTRACASQDRQLTLGGRHQASTTIADSACTTYNNVSPTTTPSRPDRRAWTGRRRGRHCREQQRPEPVVGFDQRRSAPCRTPREGLDAFGDIRLSTPSRRPGVTPHAGRRKHRRYNFAGLMAASLGAMGKFDNVGLRHDSHAAP